MRMNRSRAWIACIAVLAMALPVAASVTWYVDVNNAGDPLKDGSAAHPFDRVQTGIVAASDGLEAVSMSRVAAELGSSTMSLYRYVAAKDELLALIRS